MIYAPYTGTLVRYEVNEGDSVDFGDPLAVVEAMKMESVVEAVSAGVITRLLATAGTLVEEGSPLIDIAFGERSDDAVRAPSLPVSADRPAHLVRLEERLALLADERRPDAVAKRHERGGRTARENLVDLVDPKSFLEYGGLAIAAQRSRRSVDDLIAATPADGIVTGTATIGGTACVVVIYDYTVLAGTQGVAGHKKMDRMFLLARSERLPVVLFAEGGGGRPGDTDAMGAGFLDNHTFAAFARLRAEVPLIGVVAGRCFAGNAALLGCCDVVIATRNVSLGMAGPAMIVGGGMAPVAPDQVGPIEVHEANGVVDIAVADEAEAVAVVKRIFQDMSGPNATWVAHDQRRLRHVIPQRRERSYDVRALIETVADADSVLELRPKWSLGLVVALVRIEGRPIVVLANDCRHLGGALDVGASRKAIFAIQLANTFGFPILSLCDTPGFMVGRASEAEGLVRVAGDLFVAGAKTTVPFCVVVTRRAYGLGAQAMAAGGFSEPLFSAAWPSSEFGAMGFEGAARLGFKKELDAIEDPDARRAKLSELVTEMRRQGEALNVATYLEIDAVIDPADTRSVVLRAIRS